MKHIAVYCGSSIGGRPEYRQAARQLGELLVARGIGLVYGGGNVGLMGEVADAVLASGGRVTGVITETLVKMEVAHQGLTDLRVVTTMHERKALMAELAEAFIALPGGYGTFEELFEVLTWAQIGLHAKPCGLLNVAGYYDHLLAFLGQGVAERFMRPEHVAMLQVADQPAALLDLLARVKMPMVSKLVR